ncbi:MAG: isocitrate/isopropylmalate family dehydrogenase, partial [Actinomycetota bacterium]
MSTRTVNLAVIAGDGIGPEVIAEGVKILDAVGAAHGITFAKKEYELGARLWHRSGETLPD